MRRALVQMHVWLGLTIGLLWALQGLSGAVLVFHREVDRMAWPAATSGPMAPVGAMLESAAKATGGAPIVRLSIADRYRDLMDAAYEDEMQRPRAVLLDAATARALRTRDMEPTTPFSGSVTRWALMLHTALVSGRRGEVLVGVSGLVLFTSALTALFVAWPPRMAWKAVYSYQRWRTSMQRLYGWHRALGLTTVIIVMTLALSGALMTFEDNLRPWLARSLPHELAYRSTPVTALEVVIPPQDALAIAQRRVPEARWVRITMPKPSDPVYTIRFHQPGESRWLGRATVVVNASTGRVESVYDPSKAPLSNRIIDAALPLHDGELLGTGGRILMMLTGLTLPTLYVTGVWRWVAQRSRRRQARNGAHGH